MGIYAYLAVVNVIAFFVYGADKRKAKKGQWRIPEATLLGLAVIGGSPAAWAAMYVFHHKTKKWKFKYGVPFILLVQIIAAWYICKEAGMY